MPPQTDTIITAFTTFLTSLQPTANQNAMQPINLFTGSTIASFLASFSDSQLPPGDIVWDQEIVGGRVGNFRLVEKEIERYRGCGYGCAGEFNVYEIYTQYNKQQLAKLLKQCFLIATKVPNSSHYIQKIITLDEEVQMLFAQLIKEDGNFVASPTREYTESSVEGRGGAERDWEREERLRALDVIDRLYELEVENQRLHGELKRANNESSQARETILQLFTQIDSLKQHNESLKQTLHDQSEQLNQYLTHNQQSHQQQSKNSQYRIHLEHSLAAYKQQLEMLKTQNQLTVCRYEDRLGEMQREVERERDVGERLRDEMGFYQVELEGMIGRFQGFEKEVQVAGRNVKLLQEENRKLTEQNLTLKFQLSYKTQQILELKQYIDSIHSPDEAYNTCSSLRSSKMLASEFSSCNIGSTPNLRSSFVMKGEGEGEEVRDLRNQVKELRRECEKLRGFRARVRELEIQRNRMGQILQQYEASRGEENQILTGCLYELQVKMAGAKGSFSRSTLGEDLTN